MAESSKEPRGLRNHNPGNIRHGDDWLGLCCVQTDKSFCQFESAEYGIRALCRVLLTYQRKYGLMTVQGMISRWAPPSENDTDAYVASVSSAMSIDKDQSFSIKDFVKASRFVRAIIRHENGKDPYSDEVLGAGLLMAGIRYKAPVASYLDC